MSEKTGGTMKTLVDCGCVARVHADRSGIEIDYCSRHAAAEDLLESLKVILNGFERGVFCRSIDGDSKNDWAFTLVPFIAALGKAQAAVVKAEGTYV